MLILPIKQKWFDMILHGGKKEEYREIKPYWDKRIIKALGYLETDEEEVKERLRDNQECEKVICIKFKNGYGKKAPYFIAHCSVSIRTGKKEWGAEPGTKYYVIAIREIGIRVNCHDSDIRATMNEEEIKRYEKRRKEERRKS